MNTTSDTGATAPTSGSTPATGDAPLTGMARHRRNALQFVRFGMVGGSGVLVNMLVTFVMTKLHGGTQHDNDPLIWLTSRHAFRYTILVWVVAFVIANFYNFQLNRSWTFQRTHRRSWWAEFWPFFLVGSVAALAGLFIKAQLTNPASMFYLPSSHFNNDQGLRARAYWAQLIAIMLTLPINFLVNKLWTFRAVKHHEPGTDDLPLLAPVMDADGVESDGDVRPQQSRLPEKPGATEVERSTASAAGPVSRETQARG